MKINLERTRSVEDIWQIARSIPGGHRKRTNFRIKLKQANNALVEKQLEKINKLVRIATIEHRFDDARKLSLVHSRWARRKLTSH